MNELGRLSEERLLARFVREREPAVWDELVVRNLDRMKVEIARFKFPDGERIPENDQGAVLSVAWEYVSGMTLKGSSIGELRVAISKRVWNACMDFGRKEWRHEKKSAGSFDEPAYGEEDSAGSRFDGEMAELSRLRQQLAEEAEEDEELRNELTARVRWAIRQIANDSYREVLEMTVIQGLKAETIASRLEIELANVYQRRKRAIAKLEVILRADES